MSGSGLGHLLVVNLIPSGFVLLLESHMVQVDLKFLGSSKRSTLLSVAGTPVTLHQAPAND